MKTALKVDILKTVFILAYFLIVLTAINAWANGKKKTRNNCGVSPFKAELTSFDFIESAQCYDVEFKITFGNDVVYELSHANIDFGCGSITEVWNSQGWKMEANSIDPTTGAGGLKIDDIQNFGKDSDLKEFIVKFRYCPSSDCMDDNYLFIPEVAYKAGQCLYYEQPENTFYNDTEHDEGDEGEESDHNDEQCDDCTSGSDDGNNCDNGSTDPNQSGTDGSTGENPGDPANDPTVLTVSVEKIDPSCELNDGYIFLKVTGGVEPYETTWNTGESGLYLTDKSSGIYSFTLVDAAGSEASGEVTLANSGAIIIEENVKNPDCQGVSNGSIDLLISGGTEPYNIIWSNGLNTPNLSDLVAGSYSVTVTDAKGCSETKFISLYNTNAIMVGAQTVQPSCQDGTTGSIELSITGGTEPYLVDWNTGDTGNSISELSDGFYKTTITDLNGCTFTDTYAIQTDMGITATSTIERPNCFDDPTGSIDLSITGGTEPYSIEWSTGARTEDITGLTSGNYTATITDALGCEILYKVSVVQDKVTINYQGLSIPSCNGNNDGAINISISNGTEPYDVQWSNGATTEDIGDLIAGTYTISVTDAAGCSSDRSFMLPEPDPITINHEITSNSCTGAQDVLITASGGSLEYSYLWSNGSTSKDMMDAQPGTYEITVTDTRGCTETKTIVVDQQPIANADCLIADPVGEVMCGSENNFLGEEIPSAINYSWSVISTDGSWSISTANNQSSINYVAGSSGSVAIFKLTVAFEGGCEITCEKVIETCQSEQTPTEDPTTDQDTTNTDEGTPGSDDTTNCDNSGSDDQEANSNDADDEDNVADESNDDGTITDGNADENDGETDDAVAVDDSDEGNYSDDTMDEENSTDDEADSSEGDWDTNKDCDECFHTELIDITESPNGYVYEFSVDHEDCRYDLSHMTIEIPDCYEVNQYSNSMNWKMEVTAKDPTTGLSGIKVDDIPSFGKDANSSFTVKLELTTDDRDCKADMKCFAPTIAYKASTCVYEEVLNSICSQKEDVAHQITTYPNPTCDYVKVDLRNCDEESSYIVKLIDFDGEIVRSYSINRRYRKEFVVDLSSKKHGLYLLQMKSNEGICTTHRIIKK